MTRPTPKTPKPKIYLNKSQELTIVSDNGSEYTARVVFTDAHFHTESIPYAHDSSSLVMEYLRGQTTIELTASVMGQMTRVQR